MCCITSKHTYSFLLSGWFKQIASHLLSFCLIFGIIFNQSISFCVLQEFKGHVGGVIVNCVDTTGAGDAFVGAILKSLASDPDLYKVLLLIFTISPFFFFFN